MSFTRLSFSIICSLIIQHLTTFCLIGLQKNTKNPFFNTIKAFCLMKLDRHEECKQILTEFKPQNQKDPITIKYIVWIYTAFGWNDKATELLEAVKDIHGDKQDLGEQLFFSYVREGKLLKQ